MALNIREIVVLLIYALSINLVLLGLANLGTGLNCGELETSYSTSYNLTDEDNLDLKYSSANIIDLALGRCEGLPVWLFWVFELPIIVGLLYIIRGFVGLT